LQVWFNETTTGWADDRSHLHTASDEMFVVLEGTVVVDVGGRRVRVEAGEFCCFPAGLAHRIVSTEPPLRTLMIRAPSVDDKVYPSPPPTTERVREVRERLFAAGSVVARADGLRRELFPVAIGLEEGLSLRDWVQKERALSTFETGLGFGISTLCICEALVANRPGASHLACDPYQFKALPGHRTTYAGVGLEILEDAGVRDLVEFYAEESQIVLPRLLAEDRRFDLAFLDGNHRFEGVFLDLVYAGRLLREGGIVFVDDTQLPGVRRAIDFCVANLGWSIEDGGTEGDVHEWLVVRTGSHEAFLRPYFEFVDF
jgi:predicted O-methyltransferase YrrM